MDSSLVANAFDVLWLPIAFILFGAALATTLVRHLRLPACFWVPLACAATSLTSYLLFYVWFFDARVARHASSASLVVSVLALAWQCRQEAVRRILKQRDVWLPGVLMMLVLVTYLCVLAWPGTTANYRFDFPLPPEDNIVPQLLADRIDWGLYRHTTPPPIMRPGYRSSDRPPLQAAVVLALRPWQASSTSWTYEIVGLFCQLGWIPALYALARTIGLNRRSMMVIFIACATSGFFFVNSIYVWPKLLAATLFLTGLALLLHLIRLAHNRDQSENRRADLSEQLRQSGAIVPIVAVLFALSMLAHGGPFFSLIALPVLLVMLRPLPRVRMGTIACGLVSGALLIAPWVAYQRWYDPPGDRLLKIHLAGIDPDNTTDTRSVWQALHDEYGGLTLERYLAGRWSNVEEQFLVFGKAPPRGWVFWVQWQQFLHQPPALDFLLVGCGALLLPRWWRDRAWQAKYLRSIMAYAVAATVVWIVLMLAPNSAMVHQGSYATTALLFFCVCACLATLPDAVVIGVLGAHAALAVSVWVAWPSAVPSQSLPEHNAAYLGSAAISVIMFGVCLRMIPESRGHSDIDRGPVYDAWGQESNASERACPSLAAPPS